MRGIARTRSRFVAGALSTLALAILGCGSEGSSPPSGASSGPASSSALVTTGSATVFGRSETVLTTATGMTLYYFSSEIADSPQCTTSRCREIWPPLLSTTGSASSAVSLPGTLTVVMNANGQQVAYNGHLLYRFATDRAPGDATGNAHSSSGGTWFVATPDLAPGISTAPVTSGAAASSSYSP